MIEIIHQFAIPFGDIHIPGDEIGAENRRAKKIGEQRSFQLNEITGENVYSGAALKELAGGTLFTLVTLYFISSELEEEDE